jgi:hypothetical protein
MTTTKKSSQQNLFYFIFSGLISLVLGSPNPGSCVYDDIKRMKTTHYFAKIRKNGSPSFLFSLVPDPVPSLISSSLFLGINN